MCINVSYSYLSSLSSHDGNIWWPCKPCCYFASVAFWPDDPSSNFCVMVLVSFLLNRAKTSSDAIIYSLLSWLARAAGGERREGGCIRMGLLHTWCMWRTLFHVLYLNLQWVWNICEYKVQSSNPTAFRVMSQVSQVHLLYNHSFCIDLKCLLIQ